MADDGLDLPRPKRRKIALACNQCRTRKSRCDGIKPVCGECSQRGNKPESCFYKALQHQNPAHDEYVKSLLERIQNLEQRVEQPLEDNIDQPQYESPQTLHDSRLRNKSSGHSAQEQVIPGSVNAEDMTPVDAMGANSILEPDCHDEAERYYGSSSAVSFMEQVYQTIWKGAPFLDSHGRTTFQPHHRTKRQKHWALRGMEHLSLLPRQTMDKALNSYWDRVYSLYPFIHKTTFMQAYEQLWTSEPSEKLLQNSGAGLGGSIPYGPKSIVFHCALNVMLALATHFMDAPLDERRKLEEIFAQKSRSLCQLDLFDDGSLAVIQTLLLMTQYLQSTPFPNRCWNCIGIACRLAQGLGLHVETVQSVQRSPIEIEMRRRAWHGCVMLDAVVSMTLGRPLMLYKYGQIPLPSAVDDDFLTAPETQPNNHLSCIEFYRQTIDLYGLLADVVSQVYRAGPGPNEMSHSSDKESVFEGLDFILDIDSAISRFEAGIPDHLHWSRQSASQSTIIHAKTFEQQSSVLYVRCLHLRILLYRPIFTRYCQHTSNEEAATDSGTTRSTRSSKGISPVVAKCLAEACLENSILLIEQVHTRCLTEATGAWWYNLFYVRTASIVILLAHVCRALTSSATQIRLEAAWKKCKAALTSMEKFSPSVSRCLKGLETLHYHITSYTHSAGTHNPCNEMSNFTDLSNVSNFTDLGLDGIQDAFFIPMSQNLFVDNYNFDWPYEFDNSFSEDLISLYNGTALDAEASGFTFQPR